MCFRIRNNFSRSFARYSQLHAEPDLEHAASELQQLHQQQQQQQQPAPIRGQQPRKPAINLKPATIRDKVTTAIASPGWSSSFFDASAVYRAKIFAAIDSQFHTNNDDDRQVYFEEFVRRNLVQNPSAVDPETASAIGFVKSSVLDFVKLKMNNDMREKNRLLAKLWKNYPSSQQLNALFASAQLPEDQHKFFPSAYDVRIASRLSKENGSMMLEVGMARTVRRMFTDDELEFAVEAIFDKSNMQHVAYGTKTIRMHNDAIIFLAAGMRKRPSADIWAFYLSQCAEDNIRPIGRALFDYVLKHATGSEQKPLVALDGCKIQGANTMIAIGDLIQDLFLHAPAPADGSVHKILTDLIEETKVFLHDIYRSLIHHDAEADTAQGACRALSARYAFAGNESDGFGAPIDELTHPYEFLYSNDLDKIEKLFLLLRAILDSEVTAGSPYAGLEINEEYLKTHLGENRKSLHVFVSQLEDLVGVYIRHLISLEQEKAVYQKAIDNLPYDTCLLVEDFKQKVLFMSLFEAQSEYFGKFGISVYGAMILIKTQVLNVTSNAMEDKVGTFFLEKISNDSKEDSVLSSGVLELCLKDIRRRHPQISEFCHDAVENIATYLYCCYLSN